MARKKSKNKKKSKSVAPLAPQLLRAWKRMLEIQDKIDRLLDTGQEDVADMSDKLIDANIDFDILVSRAYYESDINRVLTSINILLTSPSYSSMPANLVFGLQELVAEAHENMVRPAMDNNGNVIESRTVLFGVPVTGTLQGALDLAHSDFIFEIKKNGWVPKHSTVACLGVLTASDALTFSFNAPAVWKLSDSIHMKQGRSLDPSDVQFQGLMRKLKSGPETRVGGYVLLFSACGQNNYEEDFAAVDGMDDELMYEQWFDKVKHHIGDAIGDIMPPNNLGESARDAIAQQLDMSLRLSYNFQHRDKDARLEKVAFVVDADEIKMNLVGLFSDGVEVCLEGALRDEIIFLADDLADRFLLESPPEFVMKGEPLPWAKPTNNVVQFNRRKLN